MSSIKHVIFVSALPLAFAASPVGRWGHQAVYVPSQQAMYVVGGQVSSSGSKITNDVLVLPVSVEGLRSRVTLTRSSTRPPRHSRLARMTLCRLTRSPRRPCPREEDR